MQRGVKFRCTSDGPLIELVMQDMINMLDSDVDMSASILRDAGVCNLKNWLWEKAELVVYGDHNINYLLSHFKTDP